MENATPRVTTDWKILEMNTTQNFFELLGRVLLSALFLIAGLGKIGRRARAGAA